MAQKNVLNKVKTTLGYDTLYPLTPYQINQALSVTGDGSNYNITIDLPADNITVPIVICFEPNIVNSAGCTVSVNGLSTSPIYINGSAIETNILNPGTSYMLLYDLVGSYSQIISAGASGGGSLIFTNKVVQVSDWVSDNTYEDFAYKADISCANVNSGLFPEVVFSVADSISGNYAPVCLSGSNIVTIYAVTIPSTSITIPTIVCTRGA